MTIDKAVPSIAILGWCDRATKIEGTHPALAHINIQVLSPSRVSHFFPVDLRGTTFIVGMYSPKLGDSFSVEFQHSDGSKAFDFVLNLNGIQVFDQDTAEYRRLEGNLDVQMGWTFQTLQIQNNLLILKPDSFKAVLKSGGQEQFLGTFHLLHSSLPLTPQIKLQH